MTKIHGVADLLKYLESAGYPRTEDEINKSIANRQIPHNKAYANTLFFEVTHIDWWISQQLDNTNKK